MIFRTYREFSEYYHPGAIERERIAAMSPAEFGEYLAHRSIERLRQKVNDLAQNGGTGERSAISA